MNFLIPVLFIVGISFLFRILSLLCKPTPRDRQVSDSAQEDFLKEVMLLQVKSMTIGMIFREKNQDRIMRKRKNMI